MGIFGIDNVRGGSYSQLTLSDVQRKMIETEIRGALDLCFRCGSSGHFIHDCKVRAPITSLQCSEFNYKDEVHDKMSQYLLEGEVFVKKAYENGDHNSYNICYITNYGNILHTSYNKYSKCDPVKKLNTGTKPLYESVIVAICEATFKSQHYSKVLIELNEFIRLFMTIVKWYS